MTELTHIDLFSGIGGFALACRWNGIKTVQFVEIDKFCQKVLQKNFEGVPIHDDIKTFTNTRCERQDKCQEQTTGIEQYDEKFWDDERYPNQYSTTTKSESWKSREQTEQERRENISGGNSKIFLLTGGFPCQPFSQAGKRKGTEDDRHLWPEMLRVIKEFKPTWVIGENVAGIRSMELTNSDSAMEGHSDLQEDGTNDYTTVLDGVCNDLEGIGYEVQPVIIPACTVGAPHRRDRIWIVAHSEPEGLQGYFQQQTKQTGIYYRCVEDRHATDTINTKTTRHGRNSRGILPIAESKGLNNRHQWEQDWYSVAVRTCVRRVDDGLPQKLHKLETSDRVGRLKALGNAIVPQVAYEIMKAILKAEGIK